jgi:hypothetical protein
MASNAGDLFRGVELWGKVHTYVTDVDLMLRPTVTPNQARKTF